MGYRQISAEFSTEDGRVPHYGLADDTCGYECQECTGYGDPVVGIQASRSFFLSIVLDLYSFNLLRSIAQALGF